MKQVREYSEKEKSIFKGIMDLLNQGYRLHEMKVADIAAAAGIGKGTVYEYFTTKEEIIRQALSYYVYEEYERFTALISNRQNFRDIITAIIDYTVDMLEARFSSLLFMVLDLGQSDIRHLICDDGDLFTEIRAGMYEHVKHMYAIGRKEKLIGENVTLDDCRLAIYGIISAFTNEVIFMRNKWQGKQLENADSLPELKERAIRLILKALK